MGITIALIPACPAHATDELGWRRIRSIDRLQGSVIAYQAAYGIHVCAQEFTKSSAVPGAKAVNAKPGRHHANNMS